MSSYTKSLDVDMFACIENDITRKFGDDAYYIPH
jgi:hypothetical protein